jgi:hypothetical protein
MGIIVSLRYHLLPGLNDFDSDIYATPAISEGKVYIRTQNALYAIGSSIILIELCSSVKGRACAGKRSPSIRFDYWRMTGLSLQRSWLSDTLYRVLGVVNRLSLRCVMGTTEVDRGTTASRNSVGSTTGRTL